MTYTGNGWREMAAGTMKDDSMVRLPGGGAEHGRAVTGFGHGRSGAGRVAAVSDWRVGPDTGGRHLYCAGTWQCCPVQVESGMVPGEDGAPMHGLRRGKEETNRWDPVAEIFTN
jgi:hypothetical protein